MCNRDHRKENDPLFSAYSEHLLISTKGVNDTLFFYKVRFVVAIKFRYVMMSIDNEWQRSHKW